MEKLNMKNPEDFSGGCLVNLITVYNNSKFSDDFVHSIWRAEQGLPFSIFNIFRIDSSLDVLPGKDDELYLRKSLEDFPLERTQIFNNDKNRGCSFTRCSLLGDLWQLINEFDEAKEAVRIEKLFFQFLDSDDIVHPDMFKIEVGVAIFGGLRALSLEPLIRQFDKYSFERLCEIDQRYSETDFSAVQNNPEKQAEKVQYSSDGRMLVSQATYGYLPVLFRFDEGIYKTSRALGSSFNFDTMERLSKLYPEMHLLIPQSDFLASMYFYRQHPGSALHSVMELANKECLEEVANDKGKMDIYVSLLINCNIDEFKIVFQEIGNQNPGLLETTQTVLRSVDGRIKFLDSGLEGRIESYRNKGWVLGLSW
jgi:hypothetical protein